MRAVAAIIAISLFSLGLSACSQPRPIPSGTDTRFYGNISRGEKFGVSVGAVRKVARTAMEARGYDLAGTTTCAESGVQEDVACAPADVFDIYGRHRGSGHETIFLEIRDDKVVRIGWSFTLLQLDF